MQSGFDYQIAIIGGGPAGATLGRLLPKGLSAILIDKKRAKGGFEKPCGGLLAPDAQKALSKYEITLPKSILVDPQIFSVKTIDLASGGIADILGEAPAATYRIVGGEVIATPGSRLYTASGVEVAPVSAGRFAPVPGAYILVTPGLRPAKLILR